MKNIFFFSNYIAGSVPGQPVALSFCRAGLLLPAPGRPTLGVRVPVRGQEPAADSDQPRPEQTVPGPGSPWGGRTFHDSQVPRLPGALQPTAPGPQEARHSPAQSRKSQR